MSNYSFCPLPIYFRVNNKQSKQCGWFSGWLVGALS
jgi:hypothetical protein